MLLFHAAIGGGSALVGWHTQRLVRAGRPMWRCVGWWLADLALLALATHLLASAAAAHVRGASFAWMRLAAQAIFGEGVALCAWTLHAWLRRPTWWACVPGLALAVLLGSYWEAYHHGPQALELTRHSLTLGSGGRHLRVAHLSDIQTCSVGEHEERAIRMVMQSSPDLILMTGDFVHERYRNTGDKAVAQLVELFRRERLRAPLGIYSVLGNTDRRFLPQLAALRALDVRFLNDESVQIALPGGKRLVLAGLSLPLSFGQSRDRLLSLAAARPASDLRVVIGHSPDFVATLAGRVHVDLALAGHTHGGQVALPGFGPPLTFSRLPRRFASGLNDYRRIPLHVTRGVGLERGYAPQIRFCCPPEVCVLDLEY